MSIYIIIFCIILVSSSLSDSRLKYVERDEKRTLIIGITLLYFLCALKKNTVGVDTKTYEYMYTLAGKLPWGEKEVFKSFEDGYVFITKVFAKQGFSFQQFIGIVYLVIYIPLYRFLRKHSKDVGLSLIIYMSYQFMVFNLSGIRQAVAMGICLIAFEFAMRRGLRNLVIFAILVLLASTIHTSALVTLLLYPTIRIRIKALSVMVYVAVFALSIVVRDSINGIISQYFREIESEIVLGGNFIFLVCVALFGVLSDRRLTEPEKQTNKFISREVNLESSYTSIMLLSVLSNIILSGSELLRASMYYTMFLMIIIPNYIYRYDNRERALLKLIMIIFMFTLFYMDILSVNQLGIIPYKFFWE